MSVVLRCPTCGTTQAHAGECDACSEGDVRYFCTNHNPGLWLDDSRCTGCGAKFGDAPPVRAERTTRDAVTRPRVGPPPVSRRSSPAAEPWSPVPTRPRPSDAEAEDGEAPTSLAEALVDMLEESRRSGGRAEDPPWREPVVEASPWREPLVVAPRTSFLAGCLGRLLLLVFALIAFALFALSSLFGVVVMAQSAIFSPERRQVICAEAHDTGARILDAFSVTIDPSRNHHDCHSRERPRVLPLRVERV